MAMQDSAAEGALQSVWDRFLSKKPVLLIVIGSDLAMMEHLNTYGRPFHQRGVEMVLDPLSPLNVQTMLGLSAADAIDAFLITGGLPIICQSWRHAASRTEFLADAFNNAESSLIVSGERIVRAEFPSTVRTFDVLRVIGSGERTFTTIATRVGGDAPVAAGTLNSAIKVLLEKRLIEIDEPLPFGRHRRNGVAESQTPISASGLGSFVRRRQRSSAAEGIWP